MRVWRILRAVDYRWTINEVLEQPQPLLDEVLTIEAIMKTFERNEEEAKSRKK
jgi:hypothetical protein